MSEQPGPATRTEPPAVGTQNNNHEMLHADLQEISLRIRQLTWLIVAAIVGSGLAIVVGVCSFSRR